MKYLTIINNIKTNSETNSKHLFREVSVIQFLQHITIKMHNDARFKR